MRYPRVRRGGSRFCRHRSGDDGGNNVGHDRNFVAEVSPGSGRQIAVGNLLQAGRDEAGDGGVSEFLSFGQVVGDGEVRPKDSEW